MQPIADNGPTITGDQCTDRSYVGIGILLGSFTNRVLMVGDNTPASRVGLMAGT